jgi:nucleoside-diphosphate-sugar epimerase
MYGHLKVMGERLADAYRRQGGTVTVVRPFSGYGEDQDARFPFGAFTARARRRDNPFEVWGDGTQVRDWIHVSDVVGAILAACEQGVDGSVNLATGRPTSFNELAQLFAAEAGYSPEIKHVLDAPRGVAYRVGDPALLNTFYTPRVSLEDGIRRALAAS